MKVVPIMLKYDYGIPERGESLEKKGFLPALNEVCDNVVPFWLEEHTYRNKNILQKEIIQFVNKEDPDVVFFILMRDEITLETIAKISQSHITINWFCDDHWRFEEFTKYVAPKLTYAITTDKFSLDKYKKIGYENVILAQWASYDYVGGLDLNNIDYKYDLSFIGAKNSSREWLINDLKDKYNIECFGAGWENGRVSYDDIKDIILHTKVNLNISNSVCYDIRYITASENHKLEYMRSRKKVEQIKARNFEIPCMGGFQLSQYTPGIEDYFNIGKEIAVFSNVDELNLYINYYLNRDTERINMLHSAYKKSKDFTYTEVLRKVFHRIEEDLQDRKSSYKQEDVLVSEIEEEKNTLEKASIYIPEFYRNNRLFDMTDMVSNRDSCLYPFALLKEKLLERNIDLSTYDINDPSQSRFVLYHDLHYGIDISSNNSYLILFESRLTRPDNYQLANHKNYKKIFTWDDELVDGDKYIKLHWPNKIPETIEVDIKTKSKLCTMIAGHKRQIHPLELYSERINIIRWFEENHIDDFDLYGFNWDKNLVAANRSIIDTNNYPSYQGTIESKKETLENYKFCICYENAKGIKGYITEKIFDCFFAGCVPIYWGAPNITEYIPKDTFIDKRDYSTYEELYDYIKNMSHEEYMKYINAIVSFIKSDEIQKFSAEYFANNIIDEILNV